LLADRLAKHGPRSREDFLFFTNDTRGPAGSNVTGKGKNEHRAKWGRSRDLSGYRLQAFAINAGGFDISCKFIDAAGLAKVRAVCLMSGMAGFVLSVARGNYLDRPEIAARCGLPAHFGKNRRAVLLRTHKDERGRRPSFCGWFPRAEPIPQTG
jgi:hypothetical protein